MFIIQTNRKHEPNWSGKEWSKYPCKIYHTYWDAANALASYWFGGYNDRGYDHRRIIIRPLTEKQAIKLIDQKTARW